MVTLNGNSLPGSHNIVRETLENGITVVVYENHSAQSVVIDGVVNAGSLYEDPAQSGLASMTARMLMCGTQSRDFDAIHSTLEEIGASLSIGSGVHKSSFYGKSLAEDLPTLVTLLADALRNPSFPTQHIERLRGELITGLKHNQQDTRYRAGRAFREHLYPENHPYHYDNRGSLETVPGLGFEDMRTFHRRYYRPVGMIVVIVGAVKAQAAIDLIRQQLGNWQNDEAPPFTSAPEINPPEEMRQVFIPIPGKTQSDIVLGVMGPTRRADDFYPAILVNSILGQFGMMGRIGNIVREKMGLAYHASSRVEGGHGPGAWLANAGVNPANVERAIEAIINEMRRITLEPVSEDELADNQAYYSGHLPLQLESNDGIAGTLLNMEMFDLGLDYILNYRDLMYGYTRDDLLAAAQHYLKPGALVIAVAGPEQN